MKIVHVIPGMTWERGGPAAVVAELSRQQSRLGHRVQIVTTTQGEAAGEHPIEVGPEVDIVRAPVRGPDWAAYAPRLPGVLRTSLHECDLLHVHSIFRFPCLAAIKVANGRLPVVVRPCGVLHRYGLSGRSAIRKRLFLLRYGRLFRRACGAWHYTSLDEWQHSWPWSREHAGFVIPNGIDSQQYRLDRKAARAAVADRWMKGVAADYVLFLGRLHAKKRVDLLLRAFMAAQVADAKLLVAGPDESGLWETLAGPCLQNPEEAARVTRVGLVTGRDKLELLAGARVFALSSEHENFGNAALEALAAGTPVIGSPHVDLVAELARHGLATVVPLQQERWTEALEDALSQRDNADFVARAQAFVAEQYGWEKIAQRILTEYEALLG